MSESSVRHANTAKEPTLVSTSRENRRQQIIEKALAFLHTLGITLFRSPQSEPFAQIKVDDHHENWPLHSEIFRSWLEHELHLMMGYFPPVTIVKDILRQLEGMSRLG